MGEEDPGERLITSCGTPARSSRGWGRDACHAHVRTLRAPRAPRNPTRPRHPAQARPHARGASCFSAAWSSPQPAQAGAALAVGAELPAASGHVAESRGESAGARGGAKPASAWRVLGRGVLVRSGRCVSRRWRPRLGVLQAVCKHPAGRGCGGRAPFPAANCDPISSAPRLKRPRQPLGAQVWAAKTCQRREKAKAPRKPLARVPGALPRPVPGPPAPQGRAADFQRGGKRGWGVVPPELLQSDLTTISKVYH